jgi:hypothetical protein
MPQKIGGGSKMQEYDPSSGRYGYGTGNEAYGNKALSAFLSKKKSQWSKREKTINPEKQKRHLGPQEDGRSYIYGTLEDAQRIVDNYSGKGTWKSEDGFKERVDVGYTVGAFVDQDSGVEIPSQVIIIIYSKTGAHIYPVRPIKKEK